MEASEPKCVNLVLNIIGVNSLRFGDLQLFVIILKQINLIRYPITLTYNRLVNNYSKKFN